MDELEHDRTIALAGVFQAALLVQELARHGEADAVALNASVRSVLITDAINTPSVFGGVEGVEMGLRHMRDNLNIAESQHIEAARYVLTMVQLQGRLKRHPDMMRSISEALADLKRELSEWDGESFSEDVFVTLAEIYKHSISTLKPRIIVQGEHGYLSHAPVVNKVRSLLLAGIRAAFLWGQLGGKRWQLVFSRRSLATRAGEVLQARRSEDPTLH